MRGDLGRAGQVCLFFLDVFNPRNVQPDKDLAGKSLLRRQI